MSLLLAYGLLLVASHVVRSLAPAPTTAPRTDVDRVTLRAQSGDAMGAEPVRLAYRAGGPAGAPAVLLLHGSPGSGHELRALAARLQDRYRTVIPDLPGFGASQRDIPDYSTRASAGYCLQLLDALGIEQAHVIGFSFGGPVALDLYDRSPARVLSLTMLSATGVQELELLGDYHLNHLVHGLQLAVVRGAVELLPHFGALDRAFLGVEYARSFYDTDQRPLRAVLQRVEPPVLIVQGDSDPLVHPDAAREHHRIVAHSELLMLSGDHFMAFLDPGRIAGPIGSFLDRVEAGRAHRHADASAERLAAARAPFDPTSISPASGLSLLVLMGIIAAATLVSEDLTCIGVGLLVAQGRIGFVAGTFACFLGIYAGDLLLYLAGRLLGRPALRRAPLRWVLRPDQVDRASRWFARRGPAVIGLSRFLPGARLPTYVAAGALHTSFPVFSLWFLLAAGVWTPLLVGGSALAGAGAQVLSGGSGAGAGLAALVTIIVLLVIVRLGVRAATHRGRRQLVGGWRRWARWEFWPLWLFYPPVVIYILWLGLRHRGLTTFTAANPAMPAGGFVGESKAAILQGLAAGGAPVARFCLLPGSAGGAGRLAMAGAFMAAKGLSFPVVVKPDRGERGSGVTVVRDDDALRRALAEETGDLLIQEHVPGREFGVFYYRRPGDEIGRIFSITDKRMPAVTGDGRRTLERLILDDPRAVALWRTYARALHDRLEEIPAAGQDVPLVEIGTHCRGAIFLDGSRVDTPELRRTVDQMSRGYDGFHFGRYDLRGPSEEAFRRGRDLRILELNGVTSESTDMYDPKNSLLNAYRILFRQWRLAFEIGALQRARGVHPIGLGGLLRLIARRSPSGTGRAL